jgi:hypothetical protein
MINASGVIKVERDKQRIVVETSPDIIDYYHWHLSKKYWILLQRPLHKAHITITNPKFHKDVNWQRAVYYDGERVDFQYDPYMIRGGYTKGFIMFYLKVYSETIDNMKKDLNIMENDGYRGLHITIGSSGKSGTKHVLYWPKMITIK